MQTPDYSKSTQLDHDQEVKDLYFTQEEQKLSYPSVNPVNFQWLSFALHAQTVKQNNLEHFVSALTN
jgi:hypothetical protein